MSDSELKELESKSEPKQKESEPEQKPEPKPDQESEPRSKDQEPKPKNEELKPKQVEKKSYKDEKNAKKAAKAAKALANYQKSTSYKEGYKNKGKENDYKSRDNYKGKENDYKSRDNDNYKGNRDNAALSAKRFELCNSMVVFLKEKIENKKLEVTPFELLFMNNFFNEFTAKPVIDITGNCNNGDNCIVWYCKFLHSNNRKIECKCEDSKCLNLHKHQALCRNPNHKDDCDMAHKMDELKTQ